MRNTLQFRRHTIVKLLGILDALNAIGYEGYISGEFLPKPNADTAAKRNISYLRLL